MNSTMIENREYTENVEHAISVTNDELIKYAQKFYVEPLSQRHITQICSMSLRDKMWLLQQYKEEIKTSSMPDLSSLY